MSDEALVVMTMVAAIGCGLVGGIFFAFSSFVMKALAALPPSPGIAAMQSINVVVLNPSFFLAWGGTALACLLLMVVALLTWSTPEGVLVLVGCLLYLVGCVGVTIADNVPLNDELAAVEPESAGGAAVWARYVPRWTAWNTVRTAASLVAAALLTIALVA